MLKPFIRYVSSGEINSTVGNSEEVLLALEQKYSTLGEVDHLDGLTVIADGWWFNVRPSNTEPLLRLNVEAKTQARLDRLSDELLAVIRAPEYA